MPYLGNNLGVAFSSYKLIDSLTASFNGTTTSFALTVNGVTPVPFPLNEQNILISVGGVPQKPDSTGTEGFRFSGSNIVFSSAPKTGEAFWGVVLAGADRVNAGVQYPDGTASVPSITFASQTTTGFYRSGSGQIGVGINGSTPVAFSTSGVQLNGSTSGSVIIASPAVAGNNTLTLPTSNGSANQFLKNGATAGSLGYSSVVEDSSGRLLVGTSSARNNFFNTAADANLQLEGAAGARRASIISCEASATAGGGLVLAHQRSGSVGGNTIVQNADVIGRVTYQGNDGTEFVEAASINCEVDGTPGANDMPGRLVFSTTADGASSPTERMRITQAGLIAMGTTDPTATPSQGFCFDTRSDGLMRIGHANGTASGSNYVIFGYNSGVIGSITQSGTAGVAYNTSSDYRLKENVVAVTDGITRLLQLKPSRFNFIADPATTVDGFIAHEAQAVVPECVTGEKDAVNDDGNPVFQGIDQSKLVPLLTAALQEAIAKIEALETRLTAAGIA
jgi:hypothetical protein